MACQQCDELVTCRGIFFVLLSHSLLEAVGIMVDHDSLRRDQDVVCFVETGMFSSCCVVVCFSVAGPLGGGSNSLG